MRFAPAAAALSLLVAVSASVGYGADRDPDPRAVTLAQQGRNALNAGEIQSAIDSFEAALAVDPAFTDAYVYLADAARQQGLQGKAIRYYREALDREPKNLAAISGEGEALLEKGAVEKARRNLSQLESLCGATCAETQELAAALEQGRASSVLTAEAVTPETVVTQN
ncbi:Tfp pilus assembly protein PilF [Altererythrobacter atlanticus]|uniref:Cellulose synthase subunit BcsC n=1 Tax=Croceibacterium atlanticum TaxID=1267766 RepID=A0A0F7KP30_9SPHN|nr:tetratricopeptide repeat protein [Croceibacterium atlanticum]AKH41344.1 cellulose synthase subunit BcsC [Croceibacterium atlanticum]MBB5734142.1 Tfp pilus assembly protein PilF [Croceibacterium atlanticum]